MSGGALTDYCGGLTSMLDWAHKLERDNPLLAQQIRDLYVLLDAYDRYLSGDTGDERIEAAWGKYHEKWFKVTPEKLSEMILTDAKAEVDAYLESVRTGHDPRPPWWEVRP